MSLSSLPRAIQMFLHAAQAGDGAALRATLHEDAVLTEDGREYRGHAIDEWVDLHSVDQCREILVRTIRSFSAAPLEREVRSKPP